MKRLMLILSTLALLPLGGCAPTNTNTTEGVSQKEYAQYAPEESVGTQNQDIPQEDGDYMVTAGRPLFDMQELMKLTEFFFRGTVLSYEEADAHGTGINGVELPVETSTIMTVRIEEVYCGKPPVEGTEIVIHYPFTNTVVSSNGCLQNAEAPCQNLYSDGGLSAI